MLRRAFLKSLAAVPILNKLVTAKPAENPPTCDLAAANWVLDCWVSSAGKQVSAAETAPDRIIEFGRPEWYRHPEA